MPKITFRHGQEFMISTGADFNRVYRVKKSVGNEGFDFFTDSDKKLFAKPQINYGCNEKKFPTKKP